MIVVMGRKRNTIHFFALLVFDGISRVFLCLKNNSKANYL